MSDFAFTIALTLSVFACGYSCSSYRWLSWLQRAAKRDNQNFSSLGKIIKEEKYPW